MTLDGALRQAVCRMSSATDPATVTITAVDQEPAPTRTASSGLEDTGDEMTFRATIDGEDAGLFVVPRSILAQGA